MSTQNHADPVAELRADFAELVECLANVLSTREAEAKAHLSYANALDNFDDSSREGKAHSRAMRAASDAEKTARALLAKHKAAQAAPCIFPACQHNGCSKDCKAQAAAPVQTAFGAGDAVRLRKSALAIFDGPECPQSSRDVIEWFYSSLLVEAGVMTTPPAAAPVQAERVPLTDEQLDAAVAAWFREDTQPGHQPFAKRMRAAIEAAHGIKPLKARIQRASDGAAKGEK